MIRLWKDNRTDAEWQIDLDELATKFIAYDERHELTAYWRLERAVRAFLTDKESDGGLQSVFDEEQYEEIHEACRAKRWPK